MTFQERRLRSPLSFLSEYRASCRDEQDVHEQADVAESRGAVLITKRHQIAQLIAALLALAA
jgi:hypothetical protein